MAEQWQKTEVVDNYHWNARLCSLRVRAEGLAFRAGQFTRLALPDGEQMLARAYSLVNAPGEAVAEFYFNIVPEGELSPRLHALKAGDEVYLSTTVAGFLTLAEVPPAKHLWMLATGTALGPFLSILKTPEPWQRFEKIVLVHGVRSQEELTYRDLKAIWQQLYPDQFTPIASITRERVAGALSERIPDAIRSGALETLAGLNITPENAYGMICGSPAMVEESLAALSEKGLRKHRRREPGHISIEVYK